jgi:hypothetical protein
MANEIFKLKIITQINCAELYYFLHDIYTYMFSIISISIVKMIIYILH